MKRWVIRLVGLGATRPWLTVALALAACLIGGVYAAGHFAMTTDTAALISSKAPWRKAEAAVDASFPDAASQIVVVVDGKTPELAEQGAAGLADALAARKDLIASVSRPDAGPFFGRNGLLFLTLPQVQSTTGELISAQPFLGPLAADPSLRGVMSSLSAMLLGVREGQTTLASVRKPIASLADALTGLEQGKPKPFSWEALMAKPGGAVLPLRRLVLVQAKLDYTDLEPGAAASDAIHQAARDLKLDAAHGVIVRLTGEVPLSDEEFASLADGAWLVTGVMLAAVGLMLWLATRSVRMMACILATTLAGLVVTAAMGLLIIGRFNLISVAFIPLFVGLGIDFGIQFAVRFRAERLGEPDTATALAKTAVGIGEALAVAAGAITLGLFAFLPTSYIGVSELGVIAGVGMVVALALNLTLLPALLILVRPPEREAAIGYASLAPLDHFLVAHRRKVLWAFGIAVAVTIALLPLVRFDFNPLHLRNPRAEAMATLTDLMKDPEQTPNTINVLTPSLAAADALAKRLSPLPEVEGAVTLSSFVPEGQAAKLAYIEDASLLLDPTLNPFDITPPPSDAETVQSLSKTATELRQTVAGSTDPTAADAVRLAGALERLAAGPPAGRERASALLIAPLNTMLDQIRNMLSAQPVSLDNLPSDLKSSWVAKDGQARISVLPKHQDNAGLKRFVSQVRAVAPNASGGPVSTQGAATTIAYAFIQAGVLSLIAVTALLYAVLRSIREVAFTLAPVVLSGFLTLGTCVLIGQPINFANIIAFPLLFGVGTAFHIYFVMAWRAGQGGLLQSSLTRAVFFSAMTTGMAFGSLWLSHHPGTASMGKILMISIVWTLVCALLFEPALLGPPPKKGA